MSDHSIVPRVTIPPGLVEKAARLLLIHGDVAGAEGEQLLTSIADDFRIELIRDVEIDEDISLELTAGIQHANVLARILRDDAEGVGDIPYGTDAVIQRLVALLTESAERIGALLPEDAALLCCFCTQEEIARLCSGQPDATLMDIALAFARDDSAANDPSEIFTAIVAAMRDVVCVVALAEHHDLSDEYEEICVAHAEGIRSASRPSAHP